jgi:hypothetical protein
VLPLVFKKHFQTKRELQKTLNAKILQRKINPMRNTLTKIYKACGYAWICVDFEWKLRQGEHYGATDDDDDVAFKFVESKATFSKTPREEIDFY